MKYFIAFGLWIQDKTISKCACSAWTNFIINGLEMNMMVRLHFDTIIISYFN